ncbi:MAG: formate dehydrogenase, partial [Pseudomonadota bacterium]
MLRKKTNGSVRSHRAGSALRQVGSTKVDRRSFLRGSGLAVGGLAAIAATGGRVTKAQAQSTSGAPVEIKKSVCTHCSVGCTVLAEVANGVWTGQEPAWDSLKASNSISI